MRLTLESERLILRPWEISDAHDMFYLWASDPEVTKYLTWDTHRDINDTKAILNLWIKEYEKPERINFAIVLKETGELIGGIDVVGYMEGVPIIGYNLAKKYWNHGYMTEACKRLINYLFSIGHKEIRIDAAEENIGSNRVIIKCGGVFLKSEYEEFPSKGRLLINRYIIKR